MPHYGAMTICDVWLQFEEDIDRDSHLYIHHYLALYGFIYFIYLVQTNSECNGDSKNMTHLHRLNCPSSLVQKTLFYITYVFMVAIHVDFLQR